MIRYQNDIDTMLVAVELTSKAMEGLHENNIESLPVSTNIAAYPSY